MASDSCEASCDADPNFAVICSFLDKFGASCGLQAIDFVDLQQMLENSQEAVSPVLINLHVKLMRKSRKSINPERWERGVVKFCHTFSNQDAWEIERFGYKKARLSAKLRLLKELLELQFDNNTSFKNKINAVTAKELRSHPIGKDKMGNAYWFHADGSHQIRVYKEDPDEETWALVAKDRQGLVSLISKLSDSHDSSSTDAVTNEDSNSLEDKTVLDTGQQDSNSSKKSSDDDKAPQLKQEVDDEDTKMDAKNLVKPTPEMPPLVEEKKLELSGIKEKYIRSDNFVQLNRKAVESAGFVDIGIINADLKRPIDPDADAIDEIEIGEPLVKRPRIDRPTLLGNKKKPYMEELDDEEDEEEESDEEEEEDVDEEEETGDEDADEEESEVGEEIEEPLMLVTGRGNGEENACANDGPIVGEAIEESILFVYGEGAGRECLTGNNGKDEEDKEDADGSINLTVAKNNYKLGTIIDSKGDNLKNRERMPPKKSPSRWDIGKPAAEEKEMPKGKADDAGSSSADGESQVLKSSFFFGPGSGFSFKAPTAMPKTSMSFGAAKQAAIKSQLVLGQVNVTHTNTHHCNDKDKLVVKDKEVTEVSGQIDSIKIDKMVNFDASNAKAYETASGNKEVNDLVAEDLTLKGTTSPGDEIKELTHEESPLGEISVVDLSNDKESCDAIVTEVDVYVSGPELVSAVDLSEIPLATDDVIIEKSRLTEENANIVEFEVDLSVKSAQLAIDSKSIDALDNEMEAETSSLEESGLVIDLASYDQNRNKEIDVEERPPTPMEIVEVDGEKQTEIVQEQQITEPLENDRNESTISTENTAEIEDMVTDTAEVEEKVEYLEKLEETTPEETELSKKETIIIETKLEAPAIQVKENDLDLGKGEKSTIVEDTHQTSITISDESGEVISSVLPLVEPEAKENLRETGLIEIEKDETVVIKLKTLSLLEEKKQIVDEFDQDSNVISPELEVESKSTDADEPETPLVEESDLVPIVISASDVCKEVNISSNEQQEKVELELPEEKETIEETSTSIPQEDDNIVVLQEEKEESLEEAPKLEEREEDIVESCNKLESTEIIEETDQKESKEEIIPTTNLSNIPKEPIEDVEDTPSETPENLTLTDKSETDFKYEASDRSVLSQAKTIVATDTNLKEEEENIEKVEETASVHLEITDQEIIEPKSLQESLDNKKENELRQGCQGVPETASEVLELEESPANLSKLVTEVPKETDVHDNKLSLDEPPETAEEPEPEHAKVQLLDLSKKPETPKAAVPPQLQSYLPLVGHYPHTEDNFAPIEEVTLVKSFLLHAEIAETKTPVDSVIIQEIGVMSSQVKKSTVADLTNIETQVVPKEEEEDIVKIRQATKAPSALEIQVDNATSEPPPDFIELTCVKQKVALLTEQEQDEELSDDMNNDDDNISEPMELEESKDALIIESKQPPEEPEEKVQGVPKEEKRASLQSLSLDFTGETPSLSEVHEMLKRAPKRGAEHEAAKEHDEEEETGGKRRKVRGKRAAGKELRKSIEEAKNKEVSSSDEEKKKDEALASPKPKKKRVKRLLLGLEIPEGAALDQPTGPRQSRRIAQIKIKEEAERRKLEEIALDEMKETAKRRSKKDEDKDYKAEKRKVAKLPASAAEDASSSDTEVEINQSPDKKKRRRKHREFDEKNPWQSSSDSSSEASHFDEDEEEEEPNYVETIRSDHEFSPESDLENANDPQPLKRARTVRKEDEELAEEVDDTNCQKCHKSDHPEWILLCDGCDVGWHCSCLRPALLVIPEGDWYCPPCQHTSLIKLLKGKLVDFDRLQTKKDVETRRKERLAYVGISLANVLPDKGGNAEEKKAAKPRRQRRSGDESDSSSGSASGSESSSSGSSSSSSDSEEEPIYKLRQRRQAHSYRFKDYDELIKSAIQDDVDVKQQSKGKDMATIAQAETEQTDAEKGAGAEVAVQPPPQEDSDEDVVKPVKKIIGKKKHRRLNSLDISSEEDEDSDEDFKGSSSDASEDDYEDYNASSSSSSYLGRRKKGKGAVRRSTRARISRFDREFINDDSEDSEAPRGKRARSDWEESEESEEDSDGSWGGRKKRKSGAAAARSRPTPSAAASGNAKRKKSKKPNDSDAEVYRKKKPKIKLGASDDDEVGRPRTRGKKINYIDALATDSEEEGRRRNQVKDEESEDEFVLNEEEDDVQDEEGREGGSSEDSNIGGLVPAVKKGSKKGKGKGGIKRIKRAQGEEEEALFPPLPDALGTDPIEEINKNIEAMDETEIGMMMEEEEYANKQLQMVAAQLEKEKRRKELEAAALAARKVEMLPAPVPSVQDAIKQPAVVQTVLAATMPALIHDQPPMLHPNAPILQQSPQSLQMHHQPPTLLPQPPLMMLPDVATPKKRGRKPKSQLTSPEMTPPPPFIATPPDKYDDSFDGPLGFNADGTPRKRRGRGKGKKTLEKEAAAAAGVPPAPKAPEAKPAVDVKPNIQPPVLPPIVPVAMPPPPPDIPIPLGGKLGVASAPQPFSQSQPKPSVITRMLQAQPGQPAYPVGAHNFGPERPPVPGPLPGQGPPFIPGGPPRGLHLGAFRPGVNHYPVIRSGAPPIRPHLYHHPNHPLENPNGPPIAERSSPSLGSPASASPLSNKSDQTPPPYAVRPPMRFPPVAVPGMPTRHPQLLPQIHPNRAYPGVPPAHNFLYPPYGEGSQFQHVPPQYQEPFSAAGDVVEGPKNFEEEENGEFGGLVSYFSSQREDDLDT